MTLPSGTLTFLFTDVEGSTKLWETHPAAMRAGLARHDALVRDAVEAHAGVVFKTVGDAFCAAFAVATDALSAALDAQRALAQEAWPAPIAIKVRMALHTGAVESRDHDYFGPPLNRVARVLATGYGGQTLLSGVTFDLVRDHLPPQTSVDDLGEHRLNDLARPERVYQLLHPDLNAKFAPLKSLDSAERPNNLPQQLTSFIGREKELAEIRGRLDTTRLLTLTGAGGSGKSRLSLQAAAILMESFPHGVFLAELAPLADPNLVLATVATVLGVTETAGQQLLPTLVTHLKPRTLLLLLDNCEHVLDASATLVDTLVRECPGVTVLATSREALGIAGESIFRIPSLSLPDVKQIQTAASLSHYESVRLFIDRALLTQPRFAVTNENAPALASICLRLDGIPLAIELAAARARSLSVEDINVKLDQRFRLLTGGSRTALPRQQTLRSLIDWSFDLLAPAEQSLLCRLSVFAGGFALDAPETVCPGGPVAEWDVLDLLTSLCDKSLVVAEASGSTTRYRLLETVRQYARDRLLEKGEGETYRDRHLAFYLDFVEALSKQFNTSGMGAAMDRLEAELDNFRAALEWSRGSPERSEPGLRLAIASSRVFRGRATVQESGERLAQAMEPAATGSPDLRAKGLFALGSFETSVMNFAGAGPLLDEALRLQQELGNRPEVADTLNALGNLATYQEDYVSARRHYVASLVIHRELGNERGIASALNNMANCAVYVGDLVAAQTAYEEALEINRRLDSPFSLYVTLLNLGEMHIKRESYPAAGVLLRECLAVVVNQKIKGSLHWVLKNLGGLVAATGSPRDAALLWGLTERLREEKRAPWPVQDQRLLDAQMAAARVALGDDAAFDEALREGRGISLDRVMELVHPKTA